MRLRSEPHVRRRREPELGVSHLSLLAQLETFIERELHRDLERQGRLPRARAGRR